MPARIASGTFCYVLRLMQAFASIAIKFYAYEQGKGHMRIERSCGVLLHITSLPGKYGIGTLGDEAFQFADMLHKGGQSYWQILPLGPVSASQGYSPYASTSTFAGNYLFISLEKLQAHAWFSRDLDSAAFADDDFVDFASVVEHKLALLRAAAADFFTLAPEPEIRAFEAFCASARHWLDDYSLFSALAGHFGTNHWHRWDRPVSRREPGALAAWRSRLQESIRFHQFVQFIFFKQWAELKAACNSRGIKIIGDIPIYITLDGADAWAHPEIFQINAKTRMPGAVAGVPPDYFSKTGQRWGNPLYRWHDKHKKLNRAAVSWWARRIRHLTGLVDSMRIDHFRGFDTYWSVPAKEATAVNGTWAQGPGLEFFRQLQEELGDLPLIAEDLGDITPAVTKLREDLGLPGMKILQFAFDFKNKNSYLPHTYTDPHCVVYTGTHDNNTTSGWFYGPEIDDATRQYILEYMGAAGHYDIHWQLIRLAFRSVANLVIIPAQDILGYGAELRMNLPGTAENNWRWKLRGGRITGELMEQLRCMAHLYDRAQAE